MTNKFLILTILFLALLIAGCSTDDSGNFEQPEDPPIEDPANPNAEEAEGYIICNS